MVSSAIVVAVYMLLSNTLGKGSVFNPKRGFTGISFIII